MLKLNLSIKEPTLLEAFKELLPQAGICIKKDKSECDEVLYTPPFCEDTLPSLDFLSLPRPLRFLDLLSFLENLPYNQALTFSHFSLDLREKTLQNLKTQAAYRLTGKECQLLHFFYKNKGQEVSKDIILQEIWRYHPDAETHTLETHVYRLRQKLEEDPTAPEILLNCKDGYWIK